MCTLRLISYSKHAKKIVLISMYVPTQVTLICSRKANINACQLRHAYTYVCDYSYSSLNFVTSQITIFVVESKDQHHCRNSKKNISQQLLENYIIIKINFT